MTDTTNALAVLEPGDGSQVEVIAGDARLALEQAWEILNMDAPPNAQTVIETQALIVTAHERVAQLEKLGEIAVAAIAGIQEAMKVVEEQRDEAVTNMVAAEEKFAELHDNFEQEVELEVERAVEMELESIAENYYDEIDWGEMKWEVERQFVSNVKVTITGLEQIGETEAAQDLFKKLKAAKAQRDEVERLEHQYDRHISEKLHEKRREQWQQDHPGEPLPAWLSAPVVTFDDDDHDPDDDPDFDLDDEDDDDIAA